MIKKLAIISNGGGIKCAYSAGVLYALATIYNVGKPEIIVGSSGSVGTLAYFDTNQYECIKNIWTESLASEKFISKKRFKKIMDIDYLIDDIFKKQKPLDYKKLANSPTKFFVAATQYETGERIFFDSKKINIFKIMRASKAMPIFYGNKIIINNKKYIDGSIGEDMPSNINKALDLGAKHIIVVKNGNKPSGKVSLFWQTYSFFVNKNLRRSINKYLNRRLNINNFPDSNIIVLEPSQEIKMHPLDNSKKNLKHLFDLGYNDTKNNHKLKTFLDNLKTANNAALENKI